MDNPGKVYLAGPFFSPKQVSAISKLEEVIRASGWEMFSPRLADNAVKMNSMIQSLKDWERVKGVERLKPPSPSHELRAKVFNDNVVNIDDADLLLAFIDDYDSGTMVEVGYSYARHVPIVTFTASNYGANLMLVHSIIGHTKSIEEVRDVLEIGKGRLNFTSVELYGTAIAEIQTKYRSDLSLNEGPGERDQ